MIIPVYNVEKYLKLCLDSVVNQSLNQIEIICVNDGSRDGSGHILREYADRDKRIVLIEKENSGYGHSVNVGIDHAQGEYIGVVEPDDYIVPAMYEELYHQACINDLDWVKGEYRFFIEYKGRNLSLLSKTLFKEFEKLYGHMINPGDYPQVLVNDNYHWRGIYRRKFLNQNKIRFHETPGAAYQDNGFLYQTFCLAHRAMYIEKPFYWYRKDNVNASSLDPRGLELMYGEYQFIDKFMKEHCNVTDVFRESFYKKLFFQFHSQMLKILGYDKLDDENYSIVNKYFKWFKKGIESGTYLNDVYIYTQLRHLIKYPESYFLYHKSNRQSYGNLYTAFIKELEQKNIVLVCAGRRAEKLFCLLERNYEGKIIGVCDNSVKVQGTKCQYIDVSSVEQATHAAPDAIYVITIAEFSLPLYTQLEKLGIDKNHIRHFIYPLDDVDCLTEQYGNNYSAD